MRFRLKRIATLCLLAALLLPGLLFEPHAKHVFWATELLSTRLLVPLAFLTALALRLGEKSSAQNPLKAGGWLLEGLIGLWLLSASVNPLRWDLSFGELSQWLSYPMIFAATWWLADSRHERHKLVALILMGGILQSLYGLLQSAGQDPFNWATQWDGRAGGFLGNPNFLGGHLALLFPLALTTAIQAPNAGQPLKKTFVWCGAFLILAGLIATQTRGAWIGAALGTGLALWFSHKRLPGLLQRSRKTLWTLGLAAIVLTLAFAARHPTSLKRLSGVFNGDEEVSRRGVLMRAAGELALRNPWLGVGPGQFRIYFPSVQSTGLTPQTLAKRPYISSEHAHNDLIQMAADSGFPALLLYLLLLAWLYKKLWQGSGQTHAEPLCLAGIAGGLAALHVHSLANFPFLIAPTQATAWAMAAIGLKACQPEPPEFEARSGLNLSPFKLAMLFVAFIAFSFGAARAARIFTQDMLWWVGEGEAKLGHFPLSESRLRKALRLNSKEDRLWYQLGLTQLGLRDAPNAIRSLQEAVRLNPHFTEARIALGKSLLELGQTAEAEAALLQASIDAPNLGDLHEPLAASLFLQKKFLEAIKIYDQAVALNIKPVTMLNNKAAALGNLGNYEEALRALQQAQVLNPGDPDVQINFAITYFKMGDKGLARQALKRARELGAQNPQLDALTKAIR
jgi:Flp pilus assembly protein TadD/O-antigen ligase